MKINTKTFHISFWLIICFIVSLLMFIYLLNESKNILSAVPLSLTPLLLGLIAIVVSEKYARKSNYYPRSITEYIIMNSIFFLLFLFVLFSLNESYTLIKIGAFVIVVLVGLYTSYFIKTIHKN